MNRVVDIHNHIIFDVDDGPRTLENSLDLLRQAAERGIRDIVATPHQFEQDLVNAEERQKKIIGNFEIVKAEAEKEGIPIQLHLAAEIFFSVQIPENIKNIPYLTVNNQKKYALIEFSMNWQPQGYKEVFYELIQEGCTPILAHPERYGYYWDVADDIIDLVKMGTLLQINAGSILGYLGTQALFLSNMLFAAGLAHIISSDAHWAGPKAGFNILRAAEKFRKRYPDIPIEPLISENPLKIIQGKSIEIDEDACYNFDKKLYHKQWQRFYFRREILGLNSGARIKTTKRRR